MLDQKSICDSHLRLHKPFMWTIFVFGMVQHQSTNIPRCAFGQNSHTITQFSSEMGISLVEIDEVGVENHI